MYGQPSGSPYHPAGSISSSHHLTPNVISTSVSFRCYLPRFPVTSVNTRFKTTASESLDNVSAICTDDGCNWSRRLLHGPTMTSTLWAPGTATATRRSPTISQSHTRGAGGDWKTTSRQTYKRSQSKVFRNISRVSLKHLTSAELQDCLSVILEEILGELHRQGRGEASTRQPLTPMFPQESCME